MPTATRSPAFARRKKPVELGRRYSLGIRVSAETKAVIDERSRLAGHSQSAIAEQLIEKALQYEQTLRAMGRSMEAIHQQSFDSALFRAGYKPVRTSHGKVWYPPDYPGVETPGFVAPEPGEYLGDPVELPPEKPISAEEAEQAARDIREHEELFAATDAALKKAPRK